MHPLLRTKVSFPTAVLALMLLAGCGRRSDNSVGALHYKVTPVVIPTQVSLETREPAVIIDGVHIRLVVADPDQHTEWDASGKDRPFDLDLQRTSWDPSPDATAPSPDGTNPRAVAALLSVAGDSAEAPSGVVRIPGVELLESFPPYEPANGIYQYVAPIWAPNSVDKADVYVGVSGQRWKTVGVWFGKKKHTGFDFAPRVIGSPADKQFIYIQVHLKPQIQDEFIRMLAYDGKGRPFLFSQDLDDVPGLYETEGIEDKKDTKTMSFVRLGGSGDNAIVVPIEPSEVAKIELQARPKTWVKFLGVPMNEN